MKGLWYKIIGTFLAVVCGVMTRGTVSLAEEAVAAAPQPAYQIIGSCMSATDGAALYDAPGGNLIRQVKLGSRTHVIAEDAQWVTLLYDADLIGYSRTSEIILYDRLMTVQKQPGQLTQEWLQGEAWVQYLAASLVNLSPVDKVKALNGYLCESLAYDVNSYTTYDALVNKVARCQGYSNAFERIMDAAMVQTDSIGGYVADATGTVSHSWNRCLIDGQYYYVDVCWNDTAQKNDWLLITQEQMEQDHLSQLIRDEVE